MAPSLRLGSCWVLAVSRGFIADLLLRDAATAARLKKGPACGRARGGARSPRSTSVINSQERADDRKRSKTHQQESVNRHVGWRQRGFKESRDRVIILKC